MRYELIAEYSQIASAFLFLAAMIWIWMKFIQPAVVTAQENANARLAEAERHRDQAKNSLESLRTAVSDAEQDAQSIRQRTQLQAQAEREAIVRESREAGERAVRSAEGELDRARAAARIKYRDELLDGALQLARTESKARVDARVNERLIANFLDSIAHGGKN